jgi:DNA-binding transcriptional ArsR family regulator
MRSTLERSTQRGAFDAVERLRRAESRLARRRQSSCGPSETDRSAMRFVLERADEGVDVTPTDLARHLDISTASVTALLDRLRSGGMVELREHASDRRKKLVRPVDRSDDPDVVDPLTAAIRGLSDQLSDGDARLVGAFLDQVSDIVTQECER